ncbi:MAG: 4-hydroxy-tetrahydrodipicolinate synthase [Reyranella sp.]|nr:4-hydroxy-tetrahydrodipicolinate synthase [Reyranella sp.]
MFDITTRVRGSIAALPTPYRFGRVDVDALERLCTRLIDRGTSALVPCGTTGEAPLLTLEEQHLVVAHTVAISAGRVPVIAGAGSNNTGTAVELARSAEKAGASALLCVTPFYLKPSQTGIVAHFRAIHDAVDIPIILYDIPSRTGCALADVTVRRLAELPRIRGLEDATGNIPRVPRLRRRLGNGFLLLSGDDPTQGAFRMAGGDGCISVTANVVPALCAALHRACDAGNAQEVARLEHLLAPLHAALFLEANPIPLKRALHRLGLMGDGLRLPLTPLGPIADQKLVRILEAVDAAELDEALRFISSSRPHQPRAA